MTSDVLLNIQLDKSHKSKKTVVYNNEFKTLNHIRYTMIISNRCKYSKQKTFESLKLLIYQNF